MARRPRARYGDLRIGGLRIVGRSIPFAFDARAVPFPSIIADDFRTLGADIRSFRTPLEQAVRTVLIPSIDRNFEVGGRPVKWRKLSPVTVKRWNKPSNAPHLTQTGALRKIVGSPRNMSKVWEIKGSGGGRFESYARVLPFSHWSPKARSDGSDYAAVHQLGTTGGFRIQRREQIGQFDIPVGRETSAIPARPYLVVQKQDEIAIDRIFVRYVDERVERHIFSGRTRLTRDVLPGVAARVVAE